MSTAILLEHTTEGFFIAADGRCLRDETTVFSDTERKIFSIVHGPACFAFALAGTVRFTPDDNDDDLIFDFAPEIMKVATELTKARRIRDATEYCQRLAAGVRKSLSQSVTGAQRLGKKVVYPSALDQFGDGMIAMLFLCGYYSHTPYQATLGFFHRDQVLAGAEIVARLGVGESFVYGSEKISELLYRSDDPRFTRFRSKNLTPIQRAENYVAACLSDEGLSVDREGCRKIGGRVHAATVTAANGFKWVPGFEH